MNIHVVRDAIEWAVDVMQRVGTHDYFVTASEWYEGSPEPDWLLPRICQDCGQPCYHDATDGAYHHAENPSQGCFLIPAEGFDKRDHHHPLVGSNRYVDSFLRYHYRRADRDINYVRFNVYGGGNTDHVFHASPYSPSNPSHRWRVTGDVDGPWPEWERFGNDLVDCILAAKVHVDEENARAGEAYDEMRFRSQ